MDDLHLINTGYTADLTYFQFFEKDGPISNKCFLYYGDKLKEQPYKLGKIIYIYLYRELLSVEGNLFIFKLFGIIKNYYLIHNSPVN